MTKDKSTDDKSTDDKVDDNPDDTGATDKETKLLAALNEERSRRKSTQAELDQFRTDTQTDQEKAIEAARAEGRTEARAETDTQLAAAHIAASAAAAGFINPQAAVRMIDLGDTKAGDTDGIESLVEALAKAEPYLVGSKAPKSDGDQGPKGAGHDTNDSGETMDEILRSAGRK